MKGRLLPLTVLIFLPLLASTQSGFQKGYIITLESDTIFGEIQNNTYYANAQHCEFSNPKTNTVVKYFPDEISGYRFTDGKFYVSKTVGNSRIFLEYLINGRLDIYFFQDKSGENHFFAENDTLPLQELRQSEGVILQDGERKIYRSRQFEQILTQYTQDCPGIEEDISSINNPNHKTLINFAKDYHTLTCGNDEECIVYEKELPRKIKVSVFGGSYYTSEKISNARPGILEPENGFGPIVGVQTRFQVAQQQENFFIGLGYFYGGKLTNTRNFIRVPLSLSFISPKEGSSPFFCYELDLNSGLSSQAVRMGWTYRMKKISLAIVTDVYTYNLVVPYGIGLNLGVSYDVK